MPNFVNANVITFNGPASVSDQYSGEVNLTGTALNGAPPTMAWFFTLSVTGAGVWACTLQFNPDPYGQSQFGWQELANTGLTIYNTATNSTLAQTNGSISSGRVRGGVVTTTGDFNLLFPFVPMPYVYRLKFQLTSALTGTIPKISFSTGS